MHNRFPIAPLAVFVHMIGKNRPAMRREIDARFGIAGSGQCGLTGSNGPRPGRGLRGWMLAQVQGDHKAVFAVANRISEMHLRQVNGAGSGLVQPRISAAQTDQLLVQPVNRPAIGSNLGGGWWEGRADGIVATGSVLLDPAKGLFVAGIDRRSTAAGEQYRQRVRQVAAVDEAVPRGA